MTFLREAPRRCFAVDAGGTEREMADLSEERLAANQATFREANERIEAAAADMELSEPVPFICECASRECTEIVHLTLAEYEDVRARPRRFFNVPGHEVLSVEAGAGVVAERTSRYVLVDKVGVAGAVAEDRYRELAD
jgi:hypothetical protein